MSEGELHSAWQPVPKAERALLRFVDGFQHEFPELIELSQRLLDTCAVRLRDILDHILLPHDRWRDFLSTGWKHVSSGLLHNPLGNFPDVVVAQSPGVALRVESVEGFLQAQGFDAEIEGARSGPYRRARILSKSGVAAWVVERNGHVGYQVPEVNSSELRVTQDVLRRFRTRRRDFPSVTDGLRHLESLVDAALTEISPHVVCDAFFRVEREYWESRCAVARLQRERQQRAGIGWCNVDHHTFDSSRAHFAQTIRILEKLGYRCRELLYAGHLAGWGSQILEQPVLRNTIFADIDLAPEELHIDFAHMPLDLLPRHRRAGLWCALHGESMLEAGLNHVAALCDQVRLRTQLSALGIKMMAPFSAFSVLYQELSEGEWWPVESSRIDGLERQGHLDPLEAADFRRRGAIGSHFENIQRNEGFKGFNQPGIDGVLVIIDPRHNVAAPRP